MLNLLIADNIANNIADNYIDFIISDIYFNSFSISIVFSKINGMLFLIKLIINSLIHYIYPLLIIDSCLSI
jgi:hypothetical protein